jgi:hypothetical protein
MRCSEREILMGNNVRERLEYILYHLPRVVPSVEPMLLNNFQRELDALPEAHVLTKRAYILRLGEYFQGTMESEGYDARRYKSGK